MCSPGGARASPAVSQPSPSHLGMISPSLAFGGLSRLMQSLPSQTWLVSSKLLHPYHPSLTHSLPPQTISLPPLPPSRLLLRARGLLSVSMAVFLALGLVCAAPLLGQARLPLPSKLVSQLLIVKAHRPIRNAHPRRAVAQITHAHTLSHTQPLSHSHTYSAHSVTQTLSHSLTHSLTLTLAHTVTHPHTHAVSHSHSLSLTYTQILTSPSFSSPPPPDPHHPSRPLRSTSIPCFPHTPPQSTGPPHSHIRPLLPSSTPP